LTEKLERESIGESGRISRNFRRASVGLGKLELGGNQVEDGGLKQSQSDNSGISDVNSMQVEVGKQNSTQTVRTQATAITIEEGGEKSNVTERYTVSSSATGPKSNPMISQTIKSTLSSSLNSSGTTINKTKVVEVLHTVAAAPGSSGLSLLEQFHTMDPSKKEWWLFDNVITYLSSILQFLRLL